MNSPVLSHLILFKAGSQDILQNRKYLIVKYRMPVGVDAVARGCIVDMSGCTLIDKCSECKVEIVKLIEMDEMFADYFAQLSYLKKRAAKTTE